MVPVFPAVLAFGRTVSLVAGFVVAITTLSSPRAAHAVELSGIGARAGIATPEGYGSTASFGMQLGFAIADSEFRIVPGLLFWESNGVTDLNPNLDVYYAMKSGLAFDPYMGAGLSIHFFNINKTETVVRDTGGSLFAGIAFPVGSNELFVEGRYTIADLTQFSAMTGFTFHMP